MAMEELIARLGLDSSAFKNGLNQADAGVSKFKQAIADLGSKIAAAFSVGALLNLAKEAVEYAGAITDSAEATQTAIEEYQVLAAMARQSGANISELDRALSYLVTRTQDAMNGNKNYSDSLKALNIDVTKFIDLPTERKVEEIGKAFIEAGESQAAYNAITNLMGERAGPRLLGMLKQLGTEGFDVLSAKIRESGMVLDALAAQKLDDLADKFEDWKIRTLVFVDEVLVGWTHMMDMIFSGKSSSQVLMEQMNPEAEAARVQAINELLEEGIIRRRELLNQTAGQFAFNVGQQKEFVNQKEAEEQITLRTLSILAQQKKEQVERQQAQKETVAAAAEETAQQQRNAELAERLVENAKIRKMLEDGRALLRLAEMSDTERLAVLQQKHTDAVAALEAAQRDGVTSTKEQEGLVKEILELEKQIAKTKTDIAADEAKAGEERLEAQKDLLDLLAEQAALQGALDAEFTNRYIRSSGEILATAGNDALSSLARGIQQAAEDAQRNFDSAARLRAAAQGQQTDASRKSLLDAADAAEARAREADARRQQLEGQVSQAQGGTTGDPVVDKLDEVKDEIEELREKLGAV